MFIQSLALVAAINAPAGTKRPDIVQAALYKNGYSAIIRQVDLDSDGETAITGIKPAVLGTFWVYTSPGLKLNSLVNTMIPGEAVESAAQSIPQILSLNKGAQVELETNAGVKITGKLIDATGIAIVETSEGTQIIPITDIRRAIIKGTPKLSFKSETMVNGLLTKASTGGKLYMLSVEPGLDWVPMYWVEVVDKSNLKITMRTSVSNEIDDFKDAELSFVAGAPNIPFLGQIDPFTMLRYAFEQNKSGPMGGGGGFGGGRGAMQNVAPAPAMDMAEAFDVPDPSGEGLGELFFYKSQKVSLKQGDKGYFVLFETNAQYSSLYTLNVPENSQEQPQETWQTFKFRNNSGVPLTSASATVYSDKNLIGQDLLMYTPKGAEGSIRIARAVDIPAKFTGVEISREPIRIDGVTHQVVTRKGTIEVQNLKDEEVPVEISHMFNGDLLDDATGAVTSKSSLRLNQLNPVTSLKWSIRLKHNEKRTFTFTYKQIV